jgi:hypothetical protein
VVIRLFCKCISLRQGSHISNARSAVPVHVHVCGVTKLVVVRMIEVWCCVVQFHLGKIRAFQPPSCRRATSKQMRRTLATLGEAFQPTSRFSAKSRN